MNANHIDAILNYGMAIAFVLLAIAFAGMMLGVN